MATEYRIFFNKNCTVINGTIVQISAHAQTNSDTVSSVTSGDGYDAEGAMKFIIATVLVYSILGVFCTLLTRFKREHGSGHLGYVQDEMVLKYIKTEKMLKIDGHRMKLMYDTQLMAERIKIIDEKKRLYDLERNLESDFSLQVTDQSSNIQKKNAKKKHDISSTVSKMGMSLLHVHTMPQTGQRYHPMENAPSLSLIEESQETLECTEKQEGEIAPRTWTPDIVITQPDIALTTRGPGINVPFEEPDLEIEVKEVNCESRLVAREYNDEICLETDV